MVNQKCYTMVWLKEAFLFKWDTVMSWFCTESLPNYHSSNSPQQLLVFKEHKKLLSVSKIPVGFKYSLWRPLDIDSLWFCLCHRTDSSAPWVFPSAWQRKGSKNIVSCEKSYIYMHDTHTLHNMCFHMYLYSKICSEHPIQAAKLTLSS